MYPELVTCCLEEALDIGAETAHRLALREKAQGMTAQVAADGSHLQQALGDRAGSHDGRCGEHREAQKGL